jgi:hypothetical protein
MKYYDLLVILRGNELWNLMVTLIVEEALEVIQMKPVSIISSSLL